MYTLNYDTMSELTTKILTRLDWELYYNKKKPLEDVAVGNAVSDVVNNFIEDFPDMDEHRSDIEYNLSRHIKNNVEMPYSRYVVRNNFEHIRARELGDENEEQVEPDYEALLQRIIARRHAERIAEERLTVGVNGMAGRVDVGIDVPDNVDPIPQNAPIAGWQTAYADATNAWTVHMMEGMNNTTIVQGGTTNE